MTEAVTASGLDRQPREQNRNRIPAFAADYPAIAQTLEHLRLNFYYCNCTRKAETTFLTPNFGPFCDDCLKEVADLAALRTQLEQVQDEWLKLEVHLARSAAYEVGYGLGLCDGASKAYRECADRLDTILSGSGETT